MYYAASNENGNTLIYQIDNESKSPSICGEINAELYAEESVYYGDECRMYKGDYLYILMNNSLYKSDGELIADNISSLYFDNKKVYYSLVGDEYETTGILCYDLETESDEEIISVEAIAKYNEDTVMGSQAKVQNIAKSGNDLYFLSTYPVSEILNYHSENLLDAANTQKSSYTTGFTTAQNEIYYIDTNFDLISINIDSGECNKLISGVYSYFVAGDDIYYYGTEDLQLSEIKVYNVLDSGSIGYEK